LVEVFDVERFEAWELEDDVENGIELEGRGCET
jgi:hypothetical protein